MNQKGMGNSVPMKAREIPNLGTLIVAFLAIAPQHFSVIPLYGIVTQKICKSKRA
jgi:hypothetical protein